MSRKFRLDYVDKSDDEFDDAMLEYVGMVMDIHPNTDPNSRLIALYTPTKDDYWYYDKRWLSEVFEEHTKAEQVHSPKHDVVNNPKHYQLVEGFEVKDLMKLLLNRIENSDVGFTHFQSSCYKEAMQYFLRFMLKNGQEDIQKGVYYMNEVLKEWQEHPE